MKASVCFSNVSTLNFDIPRLLCRYPCKNTIAILLLGPGLRDPMNCIHAREQGCKPSTRNFQEIV
jgi:hypothetical protein